eukprot:TRINITY_DN45763_c0_g1_i1.p1 TRINITY_DN45763_c0_g1~~TRINITY_DN45763_c0_g1_i1.p1  ORF type:complete len:611 (+),score=92.66 TRINITY_DN45763_c0_g1_i1:56-1888(+)
MTRDVNTGYDAPPSAEAKQQVQNLLRSGIQQIQEETEMQQVHYINPTEARWDPQQAPPKNKGSTTVSVRLPSPTPIKNGGRHSPSKPQMPIFDQKFDWRLILELEKQAHQNSGEQSRQHHLEPSQERAAYHQQLSHHQHSHSPPRAIPAQETGEADYEIDCTDDYEEVAGDGQSDEEHPRGPTQYKGVTRPRSNSCGATFYDRCMMWQNGSRQREQQSKQNTEQRELSQCTFAPSINQRSTNATRGGKPTSARLYEDAQRQQRQRAEVSNKWEREQMKECTFTPRTRKGSFSNVAPRYNQTTCTDSSQDFLRDQECTFKPAINNPNKLGFSPYLMVNAFERLSKPKEDPQEEMPFDAADFAAEFMVGEMDQTTESTKVGSIEWNSFLERLQNDELRRRFKQEQIEKEVQDTLGKPKLNTKSREIMGTIGKGNFFQRMEADNNRRMRRKNDPTGSQQVTNDKEYTFKPKISKEAKQCRRRSVSELCYTDAQRRHQIRERAKKGEDKEEKECTFQPRVSRTNGLGSPNQSKMIIAKHPDMYQPYMKQYQDKRVALQQHADWERQKRELEECTFAPEIHDMPGYLQSIASSMALVRPRRQMPEQVTHTFGYEK